MPLSVPEILEVLGTDARVHGSRSREVTAVADFDDGDATALSFCSGFGAHAETEVLGSRAAVVLCRPDVARRASDAGTDKTLIGVDNPRLAFIRVMSLRPQQAPSEPAVAASACIDDTARLEPEVRIGHFAVVASGCVIGAKTRIECHAVLYEETLVGGGCVIRAGAVLGDEGYGFERDVDGCLHRFPQLGRVILGADVEIGARACVNRGALGDTVIGRGSKVDDGSYIAHNVRIGEDCLIMAQTVLCGSAVIGDRVEISPGAVIRDKVSIGDGAWIGLGAVVVENVGSGDTVAGVPARPFAAGERTGNAT